MRILVGAAVLGIGVPGIVLPLVAYRSSACHLVETETKRGRGVLFMEAFCAALMP